MEVKSVHAHHIPANNGVDPIDVFVVWYGEQAFQVTIRCWDCAWTAYRGSCGFKTIEEYFLEQWYGQECHEHVVQLFTTTSRHTTQREEKWLFKVVRSMCQHFKHLAEKN
ncbi:hypothetical protein [Acinetobacter baumannii]|uniref:hypothetical protein n=1 Tax=Acinetobacter baumannii TaxID=470 RepID=UPI0012E31883|nr:hypothetical protein [Acinetobacter baumannii]MDA3592784.1 hypothetical protein [Acinetobacter baumannii]MUR91007.1 hypothetical protein [Acinetobacter baumannii]